MDNVKKSEQFLNHFGHNSELIVSYNLFVIFVFSIASALAIFTFNGITSDIDLVIKSVVSLIVFVGVGIFLYMTISENLRMFIYKKTKQHVSVLKKEYLYTYNFLDNTHSYKTVIK